MLEARYRVLVTPQGLALEHGVSYLEADNIFVSQNTCVYTQRQRVDGGDLGINTCFSVIQREIVYRVDVRIRNMSQQHSLFNRSHGV